VKVLVADDDVTSRRILEVVLRKWGLEPTVVADGLAADEVLAGDDAPPLVLLDWDMPGLEGPEVCRRLRRRETSNPPYVVLLTSRGEKGDVVRGLDAGANDYIAKPYDAGELRARIGVGMRMLELQADLVRVRDQLAFQATHDALTGLPNRRATLEALQREVSRARREEGVLSLGVCDLDDFKKVNDTWGHPAGDAVLVAFARRVRGCLRPYDVLGRYGGEEFLLIAPGTRPAAEDGMFERARRIVAETPVVTAEGDIPVRVSIGVASLRAGDSPDALLAAADTALYRAKAEGRNRVCYAPAGASDVAGRPHS
jgi:two-component system, cell cycle response regulator